MTKYIYIVLIISLYTVTASDEVYATSGIFECDGTVDRCGVCNGDNSTCGESNELDNIVSQKSYCSIDESIDNGFIS